MDHRTPPGRFSRRGLARLMNPMTARVVGSLFPVPRRLVPVRRVMPMRHPTNTVHRH
jgi:hypothetical protein